MSRRMLALGAAGLLVGASRPNLRLVSARQASPSPEAQVTGESDAVALLEDAASVMAALQTFGFELETTRGSSTILQGLELERIEGVVRRPADIEAKVTVSLPFGELSITAIGLDGTYWIQDPLSDGEWLELGADRQIQSLINPDALILTAVRLVQDATIAGTEKIDGAAATVVEGTVDFYAAADQVSGDATMLDGLLVEGAKDITFWIDDQNRVVEGEIIGPLLVSESDDVTRVLSVFDFDEPVEIEAPQTGTLAS